MQLHWTDAFSARYEFPDGIVVRTLIIQHELDGKKGWNWSLSGWAPGGATQEFESWAPCREDALRHCEQNVYYIAHLLKEKEDDGTVAPR